MIADPQHCQQVSIYLLENQILPFLFENDILFSLPRYANIYSSSVLYDSTLPLAFISPFNFSFLFFFLCSSFFSEIFPFFLFFGQSGPRLDLITSSFDRRKNFTFKTFFLYKPSFLHLMQKTTYRKQIKPESGQRGFIHTSNDRFYVLRM
jgi:hypothetical protein